MYPTRELIRLSVHKARLHRRLAFRRSQLTKNATRVIRPFIFLKPILLVLQTASPLAVLALGVFVRRSVFPRLQKLRTFVRWSPFVLSVVRLISARVKHSYGSSLTTPRKSG
jgi:hypothetical protein